MNSDDPEITITHPSAEYFVDKEGVITITNKDGNEIIIDDKGIEIKVATGGKLKVGGMVGTPNGQGGFNCLTNCLFSGGVHNSDEIKGL